MVPEVIAMLFRKKPKQEKPDVFYVYTQTENYKGFKRIKLSSYGYQPALDGIRRLADADLSGADIKISVFGGDSPRAVVSVGKDIVGTVWQRSFDKFSALKNGKVSAVRLEIRDGDAYLFYKV